MQSKKISRILKALASQGLDVQYQNQTYSVRWLDSPEAPIAEVLLPDDFPVEGKAFKQLANLAKAKHPVNGHVCRVCATPDFHPGDAGVAIGSVIETQGHVIPAAVGSDINCGMRLHVADLSVDDFLAQRNRFVELMKGDYFFGTRDVTMTTQTMQGLFQYGVMGWLDKMLAQPTGSVIKSDLNQLATECDKIFLNGSMSGNLKYAPEELVPESGLVRDGGLATIGGGNHFVEVQYIEEVVFNVGLIEYEKNNINQAIKNWQKSIENDLHFNFPEARFALAIALHKQGKEKEALKIAKQALKSASNVEANDAFEYLKENSLWGDKLLTDAEKLLNHPELKQ